MLIVLRATPFICLICLTGCTTDGDRRQYPNRAVRVVVPFSPGGESDLFARIMKKAIDDENLLPQPLVIQNIDGAGATIGSRVVKNANADGYKILLLHNAIFTAKYSGKAAYGPEAFEPIIGTGEFGMIVAVSEESEFKTLKQLMNAAKKNPKQVKWAANLGAPSHFAGLMLEAPNPGNYFGYAPFTSGTKRYAAIKGEHVVVSAFSVGEFVRFDGLRALAYLGEERHPSPKLKHIKTAVEQGFDAVTSNMQFWWAPKGTPRKRIAVLALALEKAMQSDFVRKELAKTFSEPVVVKGEALQKRIKAYTKRLSSVSLPKPFGIPDFPLIIGVALGIVGLLVAARSYVARKESEETKSPPTDWKPFAALALIVIYVTVMTLELTTFRWATVGFVIAFGMVMHKRSWRSVPAYGVLAVALAFGIHFVFTQFLGMELP